MSDFSDLVEEFSDKQDVPPEELKQSLDERTRKFSQELAEKILEAAELKKKLEAINDRISKLSFSILPDLFNEQSITGMSTASGVKLELVPYFKATLPSRENPEERAAALEYLQFNAPDLLKVTISVEFGMKEYKRATEILELLKKEKCEPAADETVHPATLTSWVKTKFLKGEEIPLQTLNAKIGSIVNIYKEKEKKTNALKRVREAVAGTLDNLNDSIDI